MKDKNTVGEKNNQHALKHGGEGAVLRISQGKPFIGLAADEQNNVEVILENAGPSALVKHDAIRLQTALNLYWNAVEKAAADGDLVGFDRYIARFGWLAGVTIRAWAEVKQDSKQNGGRLAQVLIDMQNAAKTHQDAPGEAQSGQDAENDTQEAQDESGSE